jgi:dTDP-4-amino-4,6-dideoxygalactose transaminase
MNTAIYIEFRPVWKPMPMQPVFQKTYPCRVIGGGVSEDSFDRGLCLPSGTAMTEADQDRVVDAIPGCGK